MQPADSKREASVFLHETMQQAPLSWPEVPEPVATRCSAGAHGVRFQYLVHVEHSVDAAELARTFEDYWKARGLEVAPSEEDLGSRYGTVYSATARSATGPWGAIEVSQTGINLYVDSACATGDVAGYE